ncbi:MAG: hypothetical protein JRF72_13545 [Deltaproteobacteria bacterium]|nr:hypothetical protein [Deltaproteobacteria bacterium]
MERRCPRLGGPVPFNYCLDAGKDQQLCFKIIDCWWETFDIVRYLQDNLPEDQFARLMQARPRPKIASLVELIEQAKSRKD